MAAPSGREMIDIEVMGKLPGMVNEPLSFPQINGLVKLIKLECLKSICFILHKLFIKLLKY